MPAWLNVKHAHRVQRDEHCHAALESHDDESRDQREQDDSPGRRDTITTKLDDSRRVQGSSEDAREPRKISKSLLAASTGSCG